MQPTSSSKKAPNGAKAGGQRAPQAQEHPGSRAPARMARANKTGGERTDGPPANPPRKNYREAPGAQPGHQQSLERRGKGGAR
eukprot:7591696-Alexandrium_andersonii.AAC.1